MWNNLPNTPVHTLCKVPSLHGKMRCTHFLWNWWISESPKLSDFDNFPKFAKLSKFPKIFRDPHFRKNLGVDFFTQPEIPENPNLGQKNRSKSVRYCATLFHENCENAQKQYWVLFLAKMPIFWRKFRGWNSRKFRDPSFSENSPNFGKTPILSNFSEISQIFWNLSIFTKIVGCHPTNTQCAQCVKYLRCAVNTGAYILQHTLHSKLFGSLCFLQNRK